MRFIVWSFPQGPDPSSTWIKRWGQRQNLPDQAPHKIALLRLDTDWHASTKHVLETLFPALVRGGVLILDDYGHFRGARKAVDDYLAEHRIPILLNRIDYTGRIGIKI